ncbi:hypothetical protein [Parasitella parasitica]|uniref:Peptidase M13 C-terminal domain-containing protein n=1 Tax=Parasitella parasitica TaxID=35722 RepID=A0A0B7MXT4_9FUNG|nr:hypothetical protein [Parasitella parasitica]
MPPTNILLQRAPSTAANVCTTPDCLATSAFIKQYVDLNVDPCSDFFEYSCGAWLKAPPARRKEKQESRGSFVDVTKNNVVSLVGIMESTYDDFMANQLKTNAEGFNVAEQRDIDSANFQKAKDYYNVCTSVERGAAEIYPDIAHIRNGLLSINETADSIPKQLAHTLAYFTRQNAPSLIEVKITRNDKDHDYNTVVILDPTISSEEDEESTEKVINKLLGQHNQTRQVLDTVRSMNIELWSQDEVKNAVENYFRVQTQLKNLTEALTTHEESSGVLYGNVSALVSSSVLIDWHTYLSDLNPEYASNPSGALSAVQEYMQPLEKLISSLTLQELQDFFIVRFTLDRFGKGMIFPFSSSVVPLANQTTSENMFAPNVTARQAACAIDVGTNLYNSVGRFFALKTIGGINEKNEIDAFIHELQTSWLNHLPGTPWLDAETKTRAVEKAGINALKPRAAINMIRPDWTDPTFIQSYYESFSVDVSSYYKSLSNYYSWRTDRQWKELGAKVLNEQWSDEGYATKVNAFYNPHLNQIEIPEGILQRVFYDTKFPKYLNYGGLGSVIGHELTHALDNQGRLYNSTGYAEDWWTPFSNEAFHNRSQCFIDQYNKDYITNRSTGEKIQIDGNNTLGENIADSGGLSIALTAYREYIGQMQQQELLLPDFETLTQEQMFFIGYTIPRCIYFDDELTGYDANDEHAPWSIRVKNSLINSAEFAKTFNCPAGSPMNPHKSDDDRCVVW